MKSSLLIFRAFLFALVLNLGPVWEIATYGSYSAGLFRDGDEAGYLAVAEASFHGKTFDELYYAEHAGDGSYKRVFTRIPNAIIDVLAGLLATLGHLTPTELGVLLDILCSFLAYLAFSCFFRKFLSASIAEVGTTTLLATPWLFAINNYLHIDWPGHPNLSGMSFSSHSIPPVMRSLHTGISYPLFALALQAGADWVLKRRGNLREILWLSFSLAILAYTYFFAWVSGVVLIGVWAVVVAVIEKRVFEREFWKESTLLVFFHLLFVLPALFIMLRIQGEMSAFQGLGSIWREQWYFPVTTVLTIIVLGAIFVAREVSKTTTLLLSLFLASYITELLVMNLQQIINAPLIPFHFTIFYLNPIQGALLLSLLFYGAFRRATWEPYLLVVFLSGTVGAVLLRSYQANQTRAETIELVSYLHGNFAAENPPVLAMLPFEKPFQEKTLEYDSRSEPTNVAALSGVHLLYQHWFPQFVSVDELIKRELLLGWLFRGELVPIRGCEFDLTKFSADAWYQNWIAMQFDRKRVCDLMEVLKPRLNVCELLRSFRVDYIVWESNILPTRPNFPETFFREIWTSSNGTYHLFQFQEAAATTAACANL